MEVKKPRIFKKTKKANTAANLSRRDEGAAKLCAAVLLCDENIETKGQKWSVVKTQFESSEDSFKRENKMSIIIKMALGRW